MGRCIRCPGSLCGQDVDDLFAYSTNKMVKIRDARLGLLHYLGMFLIVLYIVVYQLIALGGYLEEHEVKNTVRLTLQQPTKLDAKTGTPCNPNEDDCEDAFKHPSDLSYCWLPNRTKQGAYKTYNCSFMDGAEAADIHATSIMMTTAVHQYSQGRSKQCTLGSNSCTKLWDNIDDQSSYIVDPDSFTMMVDHSLTSASIPQTDLLGFLYVASGSPQQEKMCADYDAVDAIWGGKTTNKAPCFVKPGSSGIGKDYFSIRVWLQSMGVSLDDPGAKSKTLRYDGVIVYVEMEYSNFHLWSMGAQKGARYVYKLSIIPSSGYKDTRLVSKTFPDTREKQDLHGLLFVVQATGTIRSFNFTAMLVQLTTSLALVAVSTTIVNILAQYFLAYSTFYNKAMYDKTHDFSDLRAANELPDQVLDEEISSRGLLARGDRTDRILLLLDNGWEPVPTPAVSLLQEGRQESATSLQTGRRAPLVAGGANAV